MELAWGQPNLFGGGLRPWVAASLLQRDAEIPFCICRAVNQVGKTWNRMCSSGNPWVVVGVGGIENVEFQSRRVGLGHLGPMNVAFFGNQVFADVINLWIFRWDHPGFRMDLKFSDWCPCKRKGDLTQTGKKVTGKQRQRLKLWHKPRSLRSHQQLENARRDCPLEAGEECGLAITLILEIWPHKLVTKKFLLC